jgi:hypothetical protein
MGQDFVSHDASIVRGYAWHVYPDPATPGVLAGDNPFGTDEPPGPDRLVTPPQGVVRFWLLSRNTPGIQNATDGHSYLVLTEALEPPPVTPGWFVEEARLDDSFQLDQRGDRWVRLVRVISTAATRWGPVKHGDFQVDRA